MTNLEIACIVGGLLLGAHTVALTLLWSRVTQVESRRPDEARGTVRRVPRKR